MAQTLPLFRTDGYACSVLYLGNTGKQLTTCLSRVREKSYDDARLRVHTGVRGTNSVGAMSAIAPSVLEDHSIHLRQQK